mmetsp:Transcript_8065/g.20684  ORF Transcript_8065/g.20684 Transcript_8065/m.20684 type:complete len:292 (-) Transcript_8065:785-1660(-)
MSTKCDAAMASSKQLSLDRNEASSKSHSASCEVAAGEEEKKILSRFRIVSSTEGTTTSSTKVDEDDVVAIVILRSLERHRDALSKMAETDSNSEASSSKPWPDAFPFDARACGPAASPLDPLPKSLISLTKCWNKVPKLPTFAGEDEASSATKCRQLLWNAASTSTGRPESYCCVPAPAAARAKLLSTHASKRAMNFLRSSRTAPPETESTKMPAKMQSTIAQNFPEARPLDSGWASGWPIQASHTDGARSRSMARASRPSSLTSLRKWVAAFLKWAKINPEKPTKRSPRE